MTPGDYNLNDGFSPGASILLRKGAAKAPSRQAGSAGHAEARPGSKLEKIAHLLTRKEGCTAADILRVTKWPSVSVPQQARALGLKLRTEKEGRTTRYWAS